MFMQLLVMTSWEVICKDGKTLTLPARWNSLDARNFVTDQTEACTTGPVQ